MELFDEQKIKELLHNITSPWGEIIVPSSHELVVGYDFLHSLHSLSSIPRNFHLIFVSLSDTDVMFPKYLLIFGKQKLSFFFYNKWYGSLEIFPIELCFG